MRQNGLVVYTCKISFSVSLYRYRWLGKLNPNNINTLLLSIQSLPSLILVEQSLSPKTRISSSVAPYELVLILCRHADLTTWNNIGEATKPLEQRDIKLLLQNTPLSKHVKYFIGLAVNLVQLDPFKISIDRNPCKHILFPLQSFLVSLTYVRTNKSIVQSPKSHDPYIAIVYRHNTKTLWIINFQLIDWIKFAYENKMHMKFTKKR